MTNTDVVFNNKKTFQELYPSTFQMFLKNLQKSRAKTTYIDKPWKLSKFEKSLIKQFDLYCRNRDYFVYCSIYGSQKFIKKLFEIWARDKICSIDRSASERESEVVKIFEDQHKKQKIITKPCFDYYSLYPCEPMKTQIDRTSFYSLETIGMFIPLAVTKPMNADFDGYDIEPFLFVGPSYYHPEIIHKVKDKTNK